MDASRALLFLVGACLWLGGCSVSEASKKAARSESSVFEGLELTMLGGEKMEASNLQGKVVLVVNVASQCGFTPQYTGLQKLYAKYKDRDFTVIAVPCNQFGGQEPGDPVEIRQFIEQKYGVQFPILSKQNVKGANKGALFDRLTQTAVGGSSSVKWNFEKFLINRKGQVVDRFSSVTGPNSSSLATSIEKELNL